MFDIISGPNRIPLPKSNLDMNQSERETRRSGLRLMANVYLIGGALYLLVFGNYAIPFAFAQRQAASLSDTSTVRPSPMPRVRPTPAPRPQPPSPTATPTIMPTATPTATLTPTPSATATPTITPTATPAAPVAQPATYIGANGFTANWSNVTGATGYRLDVATDSSFTMYVPGYQNRNVGNVISHSLTGLNASTTYRYRVRAYNGGTSGNSNVINVTTLSATGPPVVITNPATLIASFSATLNGLVDPHGLTTTVYFQYGPTTSYGSTTSAQTKSGNTYQSVSTNISGLAASTTYHFRIVATNSGGTRYGSDNAFTTLSATGAPVVATNPATAIASSSARLNGTVDPHGLTTTVHFEYGTTTSYGRTSPSQTKMGDTYQNVSADITGLTAGTVYHFRIVGTNNAGTRYGLDRTLAAVPSDKSVAWQNNPTHDGFDPASHLVTPLTLKWSRDLRANGVTSISYPLIAQGLVFVTTTGQVNAIMALDEHTGTTIWSANIPGTYGFVNATYDSGKVFVVNFDGLMKAFDAATGTLLWSVDLPNQYAFTSPPTAANGIVFTGGAGSGGTLYAVDETNGAVLWTMGVANGDHSSPAVILGSVFVSYACPQAYAFNAVTGQELWYRSSCCSGGGGKTPVVHAAQVYVRDSYCTPQTNGLVLNANTGTLIRGFNSDRPPAFFGNIALFLQNGTLRGVNAQNGQVLWSFAGDGSLTSAPLVVNQTIYIGSSSGTLYGLNTSGQQIWSTNVGAAIPAPDEQNAVLTTGLGAGDRLLIVPTESTLAAYGN
jgi:outer membrane protein assembly factor BamB